MRLESAGMPIGVIDVSTDRGHHYRAGDEQALMHLTRHLGAIAGRLQATSQANLLLGVLGIFGTMEMRAFQSGARAAKDRLAVELEGIAVMIKHALSSSACAIYVFDRTESRRLVLAAHTGVPKHMVGNAYCEVGEGLTGATAKHRVPIRVHRVNDAEEIRERYGPDVRWKHKRNDVDQEPEEHREFLGVPIMCEGICLGVVRCLGRYKLERFSKEDEDLLVAVGEFLAVLLLRSWLIDDLVLRDTSRTRLMRMLSHQVRGRVREARASLELAETEDELVRQSLERLLWLEGAVDGILSIEETSGKLEAPPTTVVDVDELVRVVIEDDRDYALERGVRVTLEPAARPLSARIEAHLVKEALLNVINNAIRFSPEGRAVRVRVEAQQLYPPAMDSPLTEVELSPVRAFLTRLSSQQEPSDGGRVSFALISVQDQGPGIPDEEQTRVFEEFVSIDRSGYSSGTGLGLPIARTILRAFGGDVSILRSEPGRGTTLGVVLPISQNQEDQCVG